MKNILPLIFLLILTACGKAGDTPIFGGGGKKPEVEGIVSTMVGDYSGLRYTSESFDGVITSGNLKCKRGEQVDLYISSSTKVLDIYVGSFYCTDIVSPIELVTWGQYKFDADLNTIGMSPISNDYKIALNRWLRLMYLLDSDSNPNNGVTLSNNKNNIFSSNLSNHPFHPDQIFGNYTASGITSGIEFSALIYNVESFYNQSALSEADAFTYLELERTGCSTQGCNSLLN